MDALDRWLAEDLGEVVIGASPAAEVGPSGRFPGGRPAVREPQADADGTVVEVLYLRTERVRLERFARRLGEPIVEEGNVRYWCAPGHSELVVGAVSLRERVASLTVTSTAAALAGFERLHPIELRTPTPQPGGTQFMGSIMTTPLLERAPTRESTEVPIAPGWVLRCDVDTDGLLSFAMGAEGGATRADLPETAVCTLAGHTFVASFPTPPRGPSGPLVVVPTVGPEVAAAKCAAR